MFAANYLNRINLRRAAALLAPACLLLAVAPPLWAQNNFNLKISEKEMQLEHPTDMAWMKFNMWDVTYERMFDRNTPTLELTNTSTTNSITQLKLTIGDTRFHFSDDLFSAAVMLGNTTPGFDLSSSAISANGNELTVDINGGLAPGELVRFRIDLDVDAGLDDPPFFEHPDFRTVLFDMNGCNVYDNNTGCGSPNSADNAQATAMFSAGPQIGPLSFPDATVTGTQAQFFNDNFREYGIMEGVDIFEIGDGFVIPEPAGAVLAVISLLGGMLCSGRSRSRTQSS
jgi:hypothetical protein